MKFHLKLTKVKNSWKRLFLVPGLAFRFDSVLMGVFDKQTELKGNVIVTLSGFQLIVEINSRLLWICFHSVTG